MKALARDRVARALLTVATVAAVGLPAGVAGAAQDTLRVAATDDLQRALDTAPVGSVLVLEAGSHRGPVTIRRSVTLGSVEGARLEASGTGSAVVIEARGVRLDGFEVRGSGRDLSKDDAGVLILADSVTLEGLRVRESLHGIYVRGGQAARLLDNDIAELTGNGIHLWSADGAVVERNRIRGGRDGIYVAHTDAARFVRNRVSESRYGIHYMYSQGNRVAGNDLSRNVAGAALMFSRDLVVAENVFHDHSGPRGYGLLLQDVETSRIHDNELRRNRVGLRLQSSSGNELSHNRMRGNVTGLTVGSSSRDNRFTRNRIASNLRDLELTGPVPPSEWSVDGVGNEWGGALPIDLNGDGISEWPHYEADLLGERREAFPLLRLLTGSPGIRLLEWALGRVPVRGARYVTDPHPLTPGRSP